MNNFKKLPDESINAYCYRLSTLREEYHLTNSDLAAIVSKEIGIALSKDAFRQRVYSYASTLTTAPLRPPVESIQDMDAGEYAEQLIELKKERMKVSEERIQANALIRQLSREDSIKEIATEAAQTIGSNVKLTKPAKTLKVNEEREAILQLSDFHYGIEIDNAWNKYNKEISKKRFEILRDEVIARLKSNHITKIHIVNLGDLIAGRIHLQLRINSRIDTITQIMEVSEILAQFLSDISAVAKIEYYDCLDNHSRVEPSRSESIDLESLVRITNWYLRERLKTNHNININENTYGDDIITFETLGHKVIGVHGHNDKPSQIIKNLSLMTKEHYDLVLSAHFHHPSFEESWETMHVSNGSGMGTDEYAAKLRLTSDPSQNLIFVTKHNAMECLFKIKLN